MAFLPLIFDSPNCPISSVSSKALIHDTFPDFKIALFKRNLLGVGMAPDDEAVWSDGEEGETKEIAPNVYRNTQVEQKN